MLQEAKQSLTLLFRTHPNLLLRALHLGRTLGEHFISRQFEHVWNKFRPNQKEKHFDTRKWNAGISFQTWLFGSALGSIRHLGMESRQFASQTAALLTWWSLAHLPLFRRRKVKALKVMSLKAQVRAHSERLRSLRSQAPAGSESSSSESPEEAGSDFTSVFTNMFTES